MGAMAGHEAREWGQLRRSLKCQLLREHFLVGRSAVTGSSA